MQAAYNIGGHIISANAIEQSIFRFHTPRIGRVLAFHILNNTFIYVDLYFILKFRVSRVINCSIKASYFVQWIILLHCSFWENCLNFIILINYLNSEYALLVLKLRFYIILCKKRLLFAVLAFYLPFCSGLSPSFQLPWEKNLVKKGNLSVQNLVFQILNPCLLCPLYWSIFWSCGNIL